MFLGGELEVGIRALQSGDLPLLAAWRNDPEIRVRTREFRPLNFASQLAWFERISGPERRDFMFMVEAPAQPTPADVTAPSSVPVGAVGLCHWEPRDRTAEVSFYIGDTRARGKGYARAALALLHRYGFDELGLDRIWAEVYGFNEPCLKLLKSIGYVEEGRLRQHVFRGGKRVDSVLLGLMREEWR